MIRGMRLGLFSYHLPKSCIAQTPHKPRDRSRLMVVGQRSETIAHHRFDQLPRLLRPGDVLVFNDSKVIRARLFGKKPTGGKIEIFLLKKRRTRVWEVLVGGHGVRPGQHISFSKQLSGRLTSRNDRIWTMAFSVSDRAFRDWVRRHGHLPLPPYIKGKAKTADYQTVVASKEGSVAAPTAGLHFTPRLLRRLQQARVQLETITLHVGFGTFAPVTAKDTTQHRMHPEQAMVTAKTARRLNQARQEGRRIIAIGTTAVRTLEAFSTPTGTLQSGTREVNLFITPGYRFKFVHGMITNFHLPQSTLLMLVSAMASRQRLLKAYRLAIKKHYRFYSFGDAMMIL